MTTTFPKESAAELEVKMVKIYGDSIHGFLTPFIGRTICPELLDEIKAKIDALESPLHVMSITGASS